MAKTFDLKDDFVVVVVGSGAGGGTLANELAQKGVDVVCLEAGPRLTLSDIVNDGDTMFGRLTWLDKRVGTGELNPSLPLWVCKTVGGTSVHWAGAALRFQETVVQDAHDLRPDPRRQHFGLAAELPGTRTVLRQSRGQAGCHLVRMAFLGCPATTTTRCWRPAPSASAIRSSTAATWRSTRSRATVGRPVIRSVSAWQAARSARSGRRSTPKYQRRRRPGILSLGPRAWRSNITHDPSGMVTGVIYADKAGNHFEQKARAVCVAGKLGRDPAPAAEFGVVEVSRRHGELLRSSGPQFHAAHERNGLCHHARPGELRARDPDGGYRQGRGTLRSQAWLCRRIRDRDFTWFRASRYRHQPDPRRMGTRLYADH